MQGHPGVITTDQVPLLVAGDNVLYSGSDNVLYRTVRGLALTQLIIGISSFILGIVIAILSMDYSNYQGIWGGVWIFVTGIIGIASSRNSNSRCVTGTYMAFSIVSTVVTFASGLLSSLGISYYSSCDEYYGPYHSVGE